MDLISWIGVVSGLVGSIITIVVGAKKFHLHVITPALEHFKMVHLCIADIAEIKKKLAYELNPNGGNSLKDQVKIIGASVLKVESLTLAILSCSDKGIWISDSAGAAQWVNPWFDNKLHWNIQDMIGTGWKNLILPADRDRVSKEFFDSVKDGRDFIMDYSYIHKDFPEKTIKVHAVCHPMKRNNGEIIGFIGFATEISES